MLNTELKFSEPSSIFHTHFCKTFWQNDFHFVDPQMSGKPGRLGASHPLLGSLLLCFTSAAFEALICQVIKRIKQQYFDFDRINEILESDKLDAVRKVEPSDFDRASDGDGQTNR